MATSAGTPVAVRIGTLTAFNQHTGENVVEFPRTGGWLRDMKVAASALPLTLGDDVLVLDNSIILDKVAVW